MSSRHAGRQSPSPSRQTGPQGSDIPGWTGKAEQTATDSEQPLRNLASNSERTGEHHGGGCGIRVPGAMVDVEGNVHLQSNPVHALEEESATKTAKKGPVGMKGRCILGDVMMQRGPDHWLNI
ncbi:predicted protein [Histoplasma mississippiense (nom. inval.)]|nr:predicted protein [Histoplasma mississippiense (nom. inval.)]EDN04504.1 predicted protein [Histoplasma mississippiense (nom. inval.)]